MGIVKIYNQAELNSGDPDRHITYENVYGKSFSFPILSKGELILFTSRMLMVTKATAWKKKDRGY